MSALVPFPARIRFVNPDGTLTMEALKLLEILRDRVGGVLGDTGVDVFAPFLPEQAALPDIVQPLPGAEPPGEMLLQPVPLDAALSELAQQQPDYSAGTALTLVNYRFALKDTPVTPGSYGDATHVAKVTVDQQGRVTNIESVGINFPSFPSGANYSGSLTGKTVAISNGIITSVT